MEDICKLVELEGSLLYENDFNDKRYGVPITKNNGLYTILKSFNYNSLSLIFKLGYCYPNLDETLSGNYKGNIKDNKELLIIQKNILNDELKNMNIQKNDIEKFTNVIDRCLLAKTEKDNILHCTFPILQENYRIQQLLHTKMNEFI